MKKNVSLFFLLLISTKIFANECPSKSFNNFAFDFMEHIEIQKKFTKTPLVYSYLIDGPDEQITQTEILSSNQLKYPIIENSKHRAQMGYHYSIEKPFMIRFYTPGTGVLIKYKFEKIKHCWRLVEKSDESM